MLVKNSGTGQLSEMERYLFDLNGFIILRGALSKEEIADCNSVLDNMQSSEPGQWHGRVHGLNETGAHGGLNLQQIYEGGPAFEHLFGCCQTNANQSRNGQ